MSKTIVLIHGYGFDERIWSPVELAFEGYYVQHLSLPGFGDEAVEGPYTIRQLAQRFWSEIDQKISPEVHLVGHSMGGYVSIEMVALHPTRIKSLALVHSHVYADPPEKKASRSSVMEDIRANGRNAFVQKMIPSMFANKDASKGIAENLVARGMKYNDNAWYFGTQAMRDRNDHAETLRKLRVPVLMIMGEKDTAVLPALAYEQSGLVEQLTLHMYPEVGHMAMYENTSRMISDLIAFYKSI